MFFSLSCANLESLTFSSFKILSSKNNQLDNNQDDNVSKSSLPNEDNALPSDLDDEIPF